LEVEVLHHHPEHVIVLIINPISSLDIVP